MIYWQHLTRQANEAHTRALFLDAHELNQKALACAKATFEDDFKLDAESAVSAVIVSYLNLAEVSVSMKEWLQANDYFERGVHFLQTILVENDMLHEHRELIERMATHIRFEWDLFSSTYGHKLEQAQRKRALVWRTEQPALDNVGTASWAV